MIIQNINSSRGFTLLEVMIAMVIFSVGVLGLAGIQGISIQNNNTAYMRTIAMQQAYNMSDIIRTNTDNNGNLNTAFSNVSSTLGTAPTPACIGDTSTTCTTAEMAAYTIYLWKFHLSEALPSGIGSVNLNGTLYEVTVMWDEERTGATGTSCSGNSATDLKCYKIQIEI